MRPVEPVQASLMAVSQQSVAPLDLPWPAQGQAAVGAVGYGALDGHNSDKPAPTASTAKIFTALMIMKAKPLKPGQQGPLITVTDEDVAIYQRYVSQQGSVYPVTVGEQISEYQALQALLLPSANNIADMLVTWAYGSTDEYVKQANTYFAQQGLTKTSIADASGFSPQTVSTARDLVLAGELLIQDPVLAGIVSQKTLEVPGIGTINSTNTLLGSDGIVGIKTGHTDEAGGCFVIALQHKVDDTHTVTIVAAVLGANDVPTAMQNSMTLANDAKLGFETRTLVRKGQTLAEYHPAWAADITAVATEDLTGLVWLPDQPDVTVNMKPVYDVAQGVELGTAGAMFGTQTVSVPVVADSSIVPPSIAWRVFGRYL